MASVPVYLFAGPEVGEKNDEILKLRVQSRKKYGALDEYTFYTADTRIADVMKNNNIFKANVILAGNRFVRGFNNCVGICIND